MNKLTLKDLNIFEKKVLMRVDFNVPIENGQVTDDTRIVAALPSIKHVLDQGGSLILMSHCGRPKGEKNMEYSLKPAVDRLSHLVDVPVSLAPDVIGDDVVDLVNNLKVGEILVLENLRFYKEEEGKGCSLEDQDAFSKQLASYGDVYVSDAFGTAHRAHASMVGVTKYMDQCAAGFLLEKEIEYLGKVLASPEKPFVAIIGGAKISGKIDVVINLMDKCDTILIGGGMAYTFFVSQGKKIGDSLLEKDKVELAASILKQAKEKGVNLLLPIDNVVADDFSETANTKIIEGDVDEGWMSLDIGPKQLSSIANKYQPLKLLFGMVLWVVLKWLHLLMEQMLFAPP